MGDKVIISLKGIQSNTDNKTNTIEFMTEAQFYKKEGTFYIVYKETEITGMEGTTTTIKISNGIVSIIRFGEVSSMMVFEKDKKHITQYATQYGTIEMGVSVKDMRINISDDGGELFIEYDFEMGGEHGGYNSFYVKVSCPSSKDARMMS